MNNFVLIVYSLFILEDPYENFSKTFSVGVKKYNPLQQQVITIYQK